MSDNKRHGKRWTTTELLSLEREYDLLNLSVQEIATKHQRSVESILYKLYSEGLTESLYEANGYSMPHVKLSEKVSKKMEKMEEDEVSNIDSCSNYEEDSEFVEYNIDKLTERVWSLETSLEQINTMVKQMFDQMSIEKKLKKTSLKKFN